MRDSGDQHWRQMQGDAIDQALNRMSCTLVADPGDVVIFTDTVVHRTQDMRAGTRSANSIEAL